jgi:alternate signal-mediated exported protein
MKNEVSKKKKTSREKRVLIASLCIAAAVMAGSTFAWFTSKDEVTNRLSANASYNVSVTENFTPPEDWVPGQTIKKEAAAINTGNVDAFVRMWLTGDMKLVKGDAGVVYTSFAPTTLSNVTEAPYTTLKLTKKDVSNNYYRVLTDDERKALQSGELA